MYSDYRLGWLLWAVCLTLAGLLLLLFNYDLLAAGEPVVRLVLTALPAAGGAAFLLGYFSARREWARLIPAWTLFALAAMVATGGLDAVDVRVTAAMLFFGLAAAFANIYLIERTVHWWAIIPGGFMLVLGIVIALSSVVARLETLAALLFVGLGLVFVLLYWLGGRMHIWWALVPGAVLTIFGLAVLAGGDAADIDLRWWPLLLLLAGLLIGVTGARRRSTERLTVNTSPQQKRRDAKSAAATNSVTLETETSSSVQPTVGQLGDYTRPAPGATIEVLSDPDS